MLETPAWLKIPVGKTHLCTREAATYTDRHINTIRNWIRKGAITATRPGGHGQYVIPISELDDALKYETEDQVSSAEI